MTGSDKAVTNLKAACIDLDGTLIDTGPLHVAAERLALIALGIPEPASDHPVTFGAGVMPGMQMLADHYDLTSAEQVFEAYLPAWESIFESGLKPMPGADETLKRLHNAGVPLALVTSGEDEYVDKVLTKFNWARLFSCRVTLESVTNLKPHPEAYLTAAKLLELPPERCVGIEDSHSGLNALRAAGLFSVFVNRNQELVRTATEADIFLESLDDFDDSLIARLFGT